MTDTTTETLGPYGSYGSLGLGGCQWTAARPVDKWADAGSDSDSESAQQTPKLEEKDELWKEWL